RARRKSTVSSVLYNLSLHDALPIFPDSVKDNLPTHASEIYKEAFNSAWDEYKDPSDRRGDDSREETAHQVAWGAVKKSYEKNDRSEEPTSELQSRANLVSRLLLEKK